MSELLVYTTATCGPCRSLKPKLLKLQETHGFAMRIIELSEKTRQLFDEMGVRTAPTMAGMQGKELMGVAVGDMTSEAAETLLRGWKIIV